MITKVRGFDAVPCIRIAFTEDGCEIARVRVYLIRNDLHTVPYAYVEDVFVDPAARGQRLADKLMAEVEDVARQHNCYKIVATSRTDRPWVHKIYRRLGYADHGISFKKDLRTA